MSTDDPRERARATFDDVAEAYDRARPAYPAALFDDLVELANLHEGARVLEIGCGTGKATVALAARGFEITCVELGERLAAVARRNLQAYPHVEVVGAPFETWEPAQGGFDAVVAFTAFHWIDPGVRYEKSARPLHERGSLAVVTTGHVVPEDGDRFFLEMQDDYRAAGEDARDPPRPDEVGGVAAEIAASGHFALVAERRYPWEQTYSADEYLAVLDTYSGHRTMEDERRRLLYELLRARIEARPQRAVRKSYLFVLDVARRQAA